MADIKQNEESWNNAQPEHLPHPTYWPIILALGVTFFFWGFVTSIVISLVGIVVITIAMTGWVSVLREEFHHQNQQKESGDSNGS
ncbi:MAG TPA: cytochrome c oxidase subunit 4 [Balneolales bacterium]|nr:cytochrome c oxidase subunit 4 [Balneolales bacterium]